MTESDKIISLFGVAFAIVVVASAGLPIAYMATNEGYQERVATAIAQAQAYCEAVYGDPAVYQANVVGNHGGLHCDANEDGPHLHAIPEKYQKRAYEAQQAGEELDWSIETAREQAEPMAWHEPYSSALTVALAVVVIAAGLIGVILRNRDSTDD